ncbi:hypothetical protein PPERSA_04945 [Pseudocohnilembus persalinus]|uniref:Uncharacterized protein n=1 Tax=Pseudocohnilembus persalinus TaxID=266149 RepID=A0A0V0QW73_PSEPJ|nr:hypothetical protein PPERSA_04945 [Pseudocohnilembus persalinus]|eukprot:KRX06333.1 hypothetical protein PPERSA_04945 [Pseudocohnilembus persalinus]
MYLQKIYDSNNHIKKKILLLPRESNLKNSQIEKLDTAIYKTKVQQIVLLIEFNDITDQGAYNLYEAINKTKANICRIALGGNKISTDCIREIKQKSKNCKTPYQSDLIQFFNYIFIIYHFILQQKIIQLN